MKVRIKAHAKVNLGLQVIRKRADGYHDLRMVMVPIDLFDSIHIQPYKETIIQTDKWYLPNDNRNTVFKALKLMQQIYGVSQEYAIKIVKNIPTQAGLAGGSTDAAAFINYLNQQHDLQLSRQELIDLAVQVGADVPFCLFNKPALVQGIGEHIQFLDGDFDYYLFIVKPRFGVSTKDLFQTLQVKATSNEQFEALVKGIETNDYSLIQANLMNDLQERAIAMHPEIQTIIDDLISFGFDNASMTGAGSVVFGITQSADLCDRAVSEYYLKYPFVKKCRIIKK